MRPGMKSPFVEEGPQLGQMRRDHRLAALARHQRELGRDDPAALARARPPPAAAGARAARRWTGRPARRGHRRRRGWMKSFCRSQSSSAQFCDRRARRSCMHSRSMTMLPNASTRAASPGSTTVVASGCSRIAGPSTTAPTGRSSRDQMAVSCQRPPNQTCRAARAAPLRASAPSGGASAARSKCGRRPIAAVRSDTIRTGMPGSRRLNWRLVGSPRRRRGRWPR